LTTFEARSIFEAAEEIANIMLKHKIKSPNQVILTKSLMYTVSTKRISKIKNERALTMLYF